MSWVGNSGAHLSPRGDYGWVKNKRGVAGGAGYEENTTGAAESWTFNEGTGNILCATTSDVYVESGSGGYPLHSVACGGVFASLTPGIKYDNAWDANTGSIHVCSSISATPVGTNDFTLEYYFSQTVTARTDGSVSMIIGNLDSGTLKWFYGHFDTTKIGVWINGTYAFWTVPIGEMHDGNIHKVRIWCDRSANAEAWWDGVSLGTVDISAFSAVNLTYNTTCLGNLSTATTASYAFPGTLYFMRVTNSLVNIGGPNGG